MKGRHILLLSILLTSILASCSSNSGSSVNSYLMENININPLILSQKQVYLHFINSTIYNEFDVESEIKSKFSTRGFTVMQNPENSPILINANLKFYGLIEDASQNKTLQNQFLQNNTTINGKHKQEEVVTKKTELSNFLAMAGGTIGGFLISGNIGISLLSGIGIYGGSKIIEYIMKEKTYLVVIDVVISEYAIEEVETFDFRQVNQGFGGVRKTEFKDKTVFKHYQSRIFITSSKNNINDIKNQIVQSVSGVI